MHIIKFVLYVLLLVVMFYTFIILSNIIASPVYDHISSRYERVVIRGDKSTEDSLNSHMLRVIWEEAKKALFAIAIPLLLILIPVIGPILSFITASVLIAWDYVDYSLSRKTPFFKDRFQLVWGHKMTFLGFGIPLVIPFLGLLVLPFAILGATILYHEILSKEHTA
jgi:CysZ protein